MSHPAEHHTPGEGRYAPRLAPHFDTLGQQFAASVQGMWLFLGTEILLFAGLFCAYAVFRANHSEIFYYGHMYLNKRLGALNTAILICSSFTMAAAVWAVQRGRRALPAGLMILTLLGGCGFLSVKYVEYKSKWEEGLGWGRYYRPTHESESFAVHEAREHGLPLPAPPATAPHATAQTAAPAPTGAAPPTPTATTAATASAPATASASAPTTSEAVDQGAVFRPPSIGPAGLRPVGEPVPELRTPEKIHNVQTFFAIYFALTGLHGLHVIVGLAIIAWLLVRTLRGHFSRGYFTPVELGGLYWHLVDLIWIYLFPLLYLIH